MAIPDSEEERRDIISKTKSEEEQQQQQAERLPSYPRDNQDCIKPCPRFDCILPETKCEKNCDRREALLNPCTLCEHDCSEHLQTILMKPEVMQYQKEVKADIPKDFLYKSEVAEEIVELEEKKDKLQERVTTAKKQIDDHFLPNFLAKIVIQSNLPKYQKKLENAKNRIDQIERMFREDD